MTKVIKLSDYTDPPFLMKQVDLIIDLSKNPVESTATLTIEVNPNATTHPIDLVLDGEKMTLTSIALDGKLLDASEYEITKDSLVIKNVPRNKAFTLRTNTQLSKSSDLFGLYDTEGTTLVKAETEGLRRVFYCIDRPDNPASYKTTLIADQKTFPDLLANGLLVEERELAYGLHSSTWVDSKPKPSYLFALIAGKFQEFSTSFRTESGKEIPIRFFGPQDVKSEAHTSRCQLAAEVIKKSMRSDEELYGLHCDLDQQMIAAVDKYASGASETSGLNLFSTDNVFGNLQTRTDMSLLRIIEVVSHEFMHHKSGNCVTIRDWFNLAFKEGLTTFRSAVFREKIFGTDLVRLLDGKNLEEKAPIQDSYTAVRSLYTAATYEKSANIIRMMMLILGEKQFNTSLSQFLKVNDGKAVTIENLVDSLSESSGTSVRNYLPWFTETGIPTVNVTDEYDPESKGYTLTIKTTDQKGRPIPLVFGLMDEKGHELIEEEMIVVDRPEMVLQIEDVARRPIPSLLRSLSAPVYLNYTYSVNDLLCLMQYDTNQYNRCEAAKQLITRLIVARFEGKDIPFETLFFEVYRAILQDTTIDQWVLAEMLALPSLEELITIAPTPDFEKLAQARLFILSHIANQLRPELFTLYNKLQMQPDVVGTSQSQFSGFDITDAKKRRLKTICHRYLQMVDPNSTKEQLIQQFNDSLEQNMTETVDSLTLLSDMDCKEASDCLDSFYLHWQNNSSALNYWFKIQGSSHSTKTVERVTQLLKNPAFDLTNPSKVYSLLLPFLRNPYGFHAFSGQGYQLITDVVIQLDGINPSVGARLTEAFVSWDKYDDHRKQLMLNQLMNINKQCVSEEVRNTAKKGLDKAKTPSPIPSNLRFLGANKSTSFDDDEIDKVSNISSDDEIIDQVSLTSSS